MKSSLLLASLRRFCRLASQPSDDLLASVAIPSVRVTPKIIRFHLDAVREALDVPRSRIRHGEFNEIVDDAQLSFDDLLLT